MDMLQHANTEARGARGEEFCGRSALAVQPARMQSNRSQNAVNSRRSAYSSVLSVRLLSARGVNRTIPDRNRTIPERNASAVCAVWPARIVLWVLIYAHP